MGKKSEEGYGNNPVIPKDRKFFRSKKTGRVYAIEKILNRGLLILKSEDGLSTVMADEETMEFHFVNENHKIPKPFNGDG